VNLVLSSGPAEVEVPAIAGQPWSSAQKQLDTIGFAYTTQETYDDEKPAGEVISVTPMGKRAPDARLTVVLSKGHAPVPVPELEGQTFKQASDALKALGLVPERGLDVFSNTVPKSMVVKTFPASGQEAPFGGTVRITLSRGPILTTVPPLLGLTVDEASARLDDANLEFSINGSVRGGEVVVAQNPAPNSRVPLETTTVELTFGRPDGPD
jgi:beta-lactam-binding protein with PASTA domain